MVKQVSLILTVHNNLQNYNIGLDRFLNARASKKIVHKKSNFCIIAYNKGSLGHQNSSITFTLASM